MSKPVIVLNELTKSYGKHRGIENISFTVEQGEVFGFIGPNGAGKSTTIRTLMGLLKPSNGGASIFGLDCSREPARIAKDVGYLPSENCYYNNMKVKEMLFYTAELYGVNAHSRMEELAERLNLDLSRRIGDLSLGNKKKVGIVSALLPSPKLLIMDEPTSGLDPLIQQAFYDILKEENKRGVHTVDAGKSELILHHRYKKNAEGLQEQYPRTAEIYFTLSDIYKREADFERKRAEDEW